MCLRVSFTEILITIPIGLSRTLYMGVCQSDPVGFLDKIDKFYGGTHFAVLPCFSTREPRSLFAYYNIIKRLGNPRFVRISGILIGGAGEAAVSHVFAPNLSVGWQWRKAGQPKRSASWKQSV